MNVNGKFSNIESLIEARKVVINEYGPNCAVPFAYFLPEHENNLETITLTEDQEEIYFSRIKEEVLELRAVLEMLERIDRNTWIYHMGFRAGLDGEIVNPSVSWQIERTPCPSAWIVLARKLNVDTDQETLEDLIADIMDAPLVSDFEQGINYIFKPDDITGSGSDALDPDGRIRLQKYFGLAKYCTDLNHRLVDIFDDIRKLSPRR